MPSRSPKHAAFLETIKPLVNAYMPAGEVSGFAQLARVYAVMGPAGIGKNTLMEASELAVATAVTSRARKPSDTAYRRYYNFSRKEDREDMLDRLHGGLFIQAAVHPASGEVYATEPADFADLGGVTLMDVTAMEFHHLRQIGLFGSLAGAYIVTPTYEKWQKQWWNREGGQPRDYEERMAEAFGSLAYCSGDPEIRFITNTEIALSGKQLSQLALHNMHTREAQNSGQLYASILMRGIAESGVIEALSFRGTPFSQAGPPLEQTTA